MNYEYMALGRMLRRRGKKERGRKKTLRQEQRLSMQRLVELIESWINGNRSFVLNEIAKMRPIEAALTAARLAEATKDQSFFRALEARAL